MRYLATLGLFLMTQYRATYAGSFDEIQSDFRAGSFDLRFPADQKNRPYRSGYRREK